MGSSSLTVSSLLLSYSLWRQKPGEETPPAPPKGLSEDLSHGEPHTRLWGPQISETWGNWEININGAALYPPHSPSLSQIARDLLGFQQIQNIRQGLPVKMPE